VLRLHLVFLLLLARPAILPAQDSGPAAGWSLTLGGEGMRFGRVARDTAVPADRESDLRPNGRAGLRAMLARTVGAWEVQLELGWAQGDAEVSSPVLTVRDRTLDLSRYRLAPGLERRAGRVGAGELAVGLAPTLDLWTAGGESRFRLGLEGRVALRVPLGRMALENRLALGLSGPPLNQEDLGDDFERKNLISAAFGVGLRLPL
jgi:hypothetical protein